MTELKMLETEEKWYAHAQKICGEGYRALLPWEPYFHADEYQGSKMELVSGMKRECKLVWWIVGVDISNDIVGKTPRETSSSCYYPRRKILLEN